MLKIHDIKPLVEIPDYSIYIYYSVIFLAILFIGFIIYFIYTFFKSKKPSQEKEYLKILSNIEFSNQKEAAYLISKYGRLLAKEDRQMTLLEDLVHDTEEFKYKKDITKDIPKSIKAKFDTFIESLDVK